MIIIIIIYNSICVHDIRVHQQQLDIKIGQNNNNTCKIKASFCRNTCVEGQKPEISNYYKYAIYCI